MRHLMPCGGKPTKVKKEMPKVLPPRTRQTGQNPSVLLTVVGNPTTSNNIQNPDLVPREENRMHHIMPCGAIPKIMKTEMPKLLPRLRQTGQNPSVLLTVVGNPTTSNNIQNPDLIPMHDVTSIENYLSNDMQEEVPGISEKILDDGRPITMNRLYWSSGWTPGQPIGWLSHGQLQSVATSGDYWHKFIVLRGAGCSKLEIMHALFDAVHPQAIAPVMYRREGNNVTFLARCCLAALLRLNSLQNQLQVKISGPFGEQTQILDVEIVLRHTYVHNLRLHLHDHLTACISRRHDKALRMLDLSAFHMDPELSEVVFWALWAPKAATYVINMLKSRFFTGIRWLSLAENELTEIPRLDALTDLEVLDLSSNKIGKLSVLRALHGMYILDITLDGNPICALYHDEQTYIQAIKEIFPSVKKIDGVHLIRPDLPVWRRNYVPPGQTECIALVDQFLQHYFSLVDGEDRQRLQGMYHPDALFSLTCNYVPGQSTSSTARLTRYTLESRNLLRLSDYSKSQQLLSQGAEEVLAALHRLPKTEHDPYSFAVDLSYYSEDTAVIVVNGVFREPSMMNENLVRAFSRTFVLRKVASREYQIINEMLTVSNASSKQAEESFQYPKPKVSMAKLSFNPAQDLNDADRKQMIRILSRLTEMNQQWAQKCLEQTKWDIKWALVVFTELLEMNKLPGEAFEPEEEKTAEKK